MATVQELCAWLAVRGYNFVPVLDGNIHRCDEQGTKKEDHIWYVGSQNTVPSGKTLVSLTYGNYKTDEKESFPEKNGRVWSDEETRYHIVEVAKSMRVHERDKHERQEAAAKEAERLWNSATEPEQGHLYISKKQISAETLRISGIRQSPDYLLVPMRDEGGRLCGIQRIYSDGTKKYLYGQRTKGLFFRFDGSNNTGIAICEGFATAASVFEATQFTTYASFTAGNLETIARSVRNNSKDATIYICGDDDRYGSKGNIGRKKAEEAAKEVGGIALFPQFKDSESKPTDWNDLHCLEGLDETRRQIEDGIRGSDGKNDSRNEIPISDSGETGKVTSVSIAKNERDNGHDNEHEKDGCELAFPDRGKKGALKGTIENLKALLKHLDITVRYNVISKEEEILIPEMSFTVDNKDVATYACITSECNRYSLPIGNLREHISRIADGNLYNPVHTWIESRPWDGKNRLSDMYATVSSPTKLKETLMEKWFISCIAAIYEPNGVSAHGVLVFRGEQYIGKTKWLKNLAPTNLNVVKDGAILHPDNKDSVFQIISKWLVELGELDATFKKSDIAQLKAFLTKDQDVLRRAYAAKESHYARRTVFFGSVNAKSFLNDPTGNRRFWTIECDSINYDHGIDMQQFWAEVRELYRTGRGWYLSQDEHEALSKSNKDFEAMDPIEERIMTDFDWDSSLFRHLSATQVCKEIGIESPNLQQAKKAGEALRKMVKIPPTTSKGLAKFAVPPRILTTTGLY